MSVTAEEVQFTTKDKREKRVVTKVRSLDDFVAMLQDQVPDRYRHAIRYFGLLAPRAKRQTFPALFVLLGQQPSPKPKRLSWRNSVLKYFGRDPLLDIWRVVIGMVAF